MKKVYSIKKDVFLTTLEYRNTPISRDLPSPTKLLFGRKIKGQVSLSKDMLKPSWLTGKYYVINNKRRLKVDLLNMQKI